MELLGSYYVEQDKPSHDGVQPERDLRIDFRFLHIGNSEVDGFYYLGTKKLLPLDTSRAIMLYIRRALLNAYHEKRRDGTHEDVPVRIWPNQPLPTTIELKKLTG